MGCPWHPKGRPSTLGEIPLASRFLLRYVSPQLACAFVLLLVNRFMSTWFGDPDSTSRIPIWCLSGVACKLKPHLQWVPLESF